MTTITKQQSFPGLDVVALWNRQRIERLCFQQISSNTGYKSTPSTLKLQLTPNKTLKSNTDR